MPDREKVIKGLEQFISDFKPYCGNEADWGRVFDALALLKAQEPRVLTLGDLRDIGSVWALNTPPYLYMDTNPRYRRIVGSWVAWRNIYELISGLYPTYNADNYGKIWRCWSARPTDAQREVVKWDDDTNPYL